MVGAAGTWGRFYLKAFVDHPDCEVHDVITPEHVLDAPPQPPFLHSPSL